MVLSIRGLRHSYGDLTTISSLDLDLDADGVLGIVGPSGCGESTAPRTGLRPARAESAGTIALGGTDTATGRLEHCAYMPQRDLLLAARRSTTRRWRCATAASPGRTPGCRLRSCSSASVSRASSAPGRTSSRAGCASASPLAWHPLLSENRSRPRALRLTQCDHPRQMQSWLAGASERPRTVVLVTGEHRGGPLPLRPGDSTPAPASAVTELTSPTTRVTDRRRRVAPTVRRGPRAAMRALRGSGEPQMARAAR